MKRIGRAVAIVAIGALSIGALAGCGASLDREVSVQGLILEVPADWLETVGSENSDSCGTVSFAEEAEDRDEDETGNAIEVSYCRVPGINSQEQLAEGAEGTEGAVGQPSVSGDTAEGASKEEVIDDELFGKATSAASMPRTAVEAMAAKQVKLEKDQGVIAWSIDDVETRVIDGAQVTSYEYSFVKEIEGERRKYEYKTVYISTPAVMYEISIVGDAVRADALIDTIEL